ncbi:MAG: helix-turn-helix domain-containing protein [Acidimicrobiia bacterium]|nr:helix-turn-helix domain-containing protein [Acidimicrobiia bacterium]
MSEQIDPLVFGHRLRHFRREANLTLDDLGARVGKPAPYLSTIETGKREPKLSLISALAAALDMPLTALLDPTPPSRRARLEIAFERIQAEALYRDLTLPDLKVSAKLPDEVLETIVGLFEGLRDRAQIRAATPEEARRENADLRHHQRNLGNYFEDIEAVTKPALEAIGYSGSGALSQRDLLDLASHFGFTIHAAGDVPHAVRSVTDLRSNRIFIPQRNALRTRAARSVVLQTLGHFVLGHTDPTGFGDFLRQRLEANYFAGAMLVPESAAIPFLSAARDDRDLSVEDLKERFYVSYEMAAHRFTNLATEHLGIAVHMIRSDEEGIIWKAYENDGVPFPVDPSGAIEGQRLCRHWGTRMVFQSEDKFSIHYQYTDTPAGTFWSSTHVEADREPFHAITVGTSFNQAKWFRGRDTDNHTVSACPDGDCCRRPPQDLIARWEGLVWPSTRPHSHVLAALPAGTFPGVDMTEIYEFLERHPQ